MTKTVADPDVKETIRLNLLSNENWITVHVKTVPSGDEWVSKLDVLSTQDRDIGADRSFRHKSRKEAAGAMITHLCQTYDEVKVVSKGRSEQTVSIDNICRK